MRRFDGNVSSGDFEIAQDRRSPRKQALRDNLERYENAAVSFHANAVMPEPAPFYATAMVC